MKGKILKLILLFVFIVFVCSTITYVVVKQNSVVCKSINVHIDSKNSFVDKNMILNYLRAKDIKIDTTVRIKNLNFDKIEDTLKKNDYIKNAEIFTDFWGNIQINIQQKMPIARVVTKTNKQFYISEDKDIFPISPKYTPIVPILSGEINNDFFNFENNKKFNNQLFDFLLLINNSELWKNQITQIYITKDTNIYLQPRVGDQKIVLGKINNYEFKMTKLLSLYKDLFATADINEYKEINLIYSNHIVCKKR